MKMNIKMTSVEVYQKSKKMSSEELQEHMKNTRSGNGAHKNHKKYDRKNKSWKSNY